ncbi:MAG: aminotransferase class I/II-fold pyridoxal phosphate-dependent enzyme [Chitinivibrionales bacterium]|nr:aminotransferase class I/II-fold pyridoxal phosphate-dependent enzyme [Chitinivibrionales bacterium]
MIAFSQAATQMRSSEIRRLMKLAADPAIISFAGGMPNNSLFPVEQVDELMRRIALEHKQAGFQYSPTSGYPPLLDTVRALLRKKRIKVENGALLITTGAQQAINLVTKVLCDPGDRIITEYPSFIGALAAFKSYGADTGEGLALSSDGIDPAELDAALAAGGDRVKLVYLNTHFHNPAGITYTPQKKQALISVLENHNVVVLEDDPYGDLYFEDESKRLVTPLAALSEGTVPVCYAGSFSKIFGPGMRLGFLWGPAELIEKCELAKQSMDACSGAFTQVLAHYFCSWGYLEPYLEKLRRAYRHRATLLLEALNASMPQEVGWTIPRGGFYVWVTLPQAIDASAVFDSSLSHGAAFVIGNAFDPSGSRNDCLRLAFSHTPEEKIETGVGIIAAAVKKLM